MAGLPNSSRAFIIGDFEKGLTIVITDPVMVIHYSIEELANGIDNMLKGADTTTLMAALVRELVPILRGVALDDLLKKAAEFDAGRFDAATAARWRAAFTEIDSAATIARTIKSGGSVNTVDFCIGLDIDPSEVAMRWRMANPAQSIIKYLGEMSAEGASIANRPLVPPIDGIDIDGLDIPPPWKPDP